MKMTMRNRELEVFTMKKIMNRNALHCAGFFIFSRMFGKNVRYIKSGQFDYWSIFRLYQNSKK